MVAPTWTDNRGNGSALNKLMSTEFTTSAVLMELATYTKKMGMKVLVEWTPRAGTREADASANGDSSLFDPRRRVHLERDAQWEVLSGALRMGCEADVKQKQRQLVLEQRRGSQTEPASVRRSASRMGNYVLLTHGDLPWSLVELFRASLITIASRVCLNHRPPFLSFFLLSHFPLSPRLSLTVSFSKQFYFANRCVVLRDCVGIVSCGILPLGRDFACSGYPSPSVIPLIRPFSTHISRLNQLLIQLINSSFNPPGRRWCQTPPSLRRCQTLPGRRRCQTPPGRRRCQTPPGLRRCQTLPGRRRCQTPPGRRRCQTPPGRRRCQTCEIFFC